MRRGQVPLFDDCNWHRVGCGRARGSRIRLTEGNDLQKFESPMVTDCCGKSIYDVKPLTLTRALQDASLSLFWKEAGTMASIGKMVNRFFQSSLRKFLVGLVLTVFVMWGVLTIWSMFLFPGVAIYEAKYLHSVSDTIHVFETKINSEIQKRGHQFFGTADTRSLHKVRNYRPYLINLQNNVTLFELDRASVDGVRNFKLDRRPMVLHQDCFFQSNHGSFSIACREESIPHACDVINGKEICEEYKLFCINEECEESYVIGSHGGDALVFANGMFFAPAIREEYYSALARGADE